MSNVIAFSPKRSTPIGSTPQEIAETYRRFAEIHEENALRELRAARNLRDCALHMLEGSEVYHV